MWLCESDCDGNWDRFDWRLTEECEQQGCGSQTLVKYIWPFPEMNFVPYTVEVQYSGTLSLHRPLWGFAHVATVLQSLRGADMAAIHDLPFCNILAQILASLRIPARRFAPRNGMR